MVPAFVPTSEYYADWQLVSPLGSGQRGVLPHSPFYYRPGPASCSGAGPVLRLPKTAPNGFDYTLTSEVSSITFSLGAKEVLGTISSAEMEVVGQT
jgi:hypothetical protein